MLLRTLRKKQVSVLILTPRWKYDLCGKSNITKSFIKILRNIDPEAKFIRITCAVLEEEGHVERIKEAEDLKVQLKGYIHPRARGRKRTANLQWLNDYAVTYYQHVVSETNYDFIIGHTPYFTDGCLNLRDSRRDSGHTPKAILIVHELMQLDTGETDEALLREWLCEAEVVFSMEKSIRDEITRQIPMIEVEKVPLHKEYIPGYPIEFFEINSEERRKSESERERETEIMMITPMKKDEMKGFDFALAVNSVSNACMDSKKTTLTMLVQNKSDKEEWEKEYRRVLRAKNQRLTFKCELIADIEELKFYTRKSDLFLFPLQELSSLFGEEALAAIASGVPVLVSSHSGVGSFLLEMNEKGSVVDSMDERLWAERIIEKIKNPYDINDLKERLLLDTRIAFIHQEFTTVICGVFYVSLNWQC